MQRLTYAKTLREEIWVWSQIYAQRDETDRLKKQNRMIRARLLEFKLSPQQKDIVSQGKVRTIVDSD